MSAEKRKKSKTASDPAVGLACEWTNDDNGPNETQCGHSFICMEDGPRENGFKFCPFCGGRIALKQANDKDQPRPPKS